MKIHINLRTNHPNQLSLLKMILLAKNKFEWPSYADVENFMAPDVKRCDYVIGKIRDRKIHMGMIYR